MVSSYEVVDAVLQNVNLATNFTSFDLQLGEEVLRVEGSLIGSYKQERGTNSFVSVDAVVNRSEYKVLLLEVYLDASTDSSMLVNSGLVGPHIKLYLLQGSTVYLFETAIPSNLPIPMVENEEEIVEQEICWFMDIVEPVEIVEVETTPEILEELGMFLTIIRILQRPLHQTIQSI